MKGLDCGSSSGTTTYIWVNCGGAPCERERGDDGAALCTCTQIYESTTYNTIGGDCDPAACSRIWSGSGPEGKVAPSGPSAGQVLAAYYEGHGLQDKLFFPPASCGD
jgi:hypothetical protein